MKKRWKKPQLIVLIRGRPEESVLFFCKLVWSGSGPSGWGLPCTSQPEDPLEPCIELTFT
jgi:hypothetical protein